MKDLMIKEYSKEEREQIWENIKPGDVLFVFEKTGWTRDEYYVKKLKVIKKTPKGSLRLDNGELLKYLPYNVYLESEVVNEWIEKIQLEKELMYLFSDIDRNRKVVKSNLDYDTALHLKEILQNLLKEI